MFGLSCLFSSASQEPLVKALVPFIISSKEVRARVCLYFIVELREQAREPLDLSMFWMPAMHFYLHEARLHGDIIDMEVHVDVTGVDGGGEDSVPVCVSRSSLLAVSGAGAAVRPLHAPRGPRG